MNLPGLASTRGVKLQKYRKFDDIGLILCSSTRLEDVPCADRFSVEDPLVVSISFHFIFNRRTSEHQILLINGDVYFNRSGR